MSGQTLIPNNPTTAVACALCGKQVDRADGYRIAVTASNVPGIASFNCPEGEHFCCCLDHAEQAVAICLHTHILPAIAARQAEQTAPAEEPAQ